MYLGVGATAIALTTWAYALADTSAGRLDATTYLVPPLAIGLAWLLLAWSVKPSAWLGVALTRRTTHPTVGPPPATVPGTHH